MERDRNPQRSLRPLNIGNIVSVGVHLYRSNFKLYVSLAFQALLWLLIPIYGWARSLAINAQISRLAFSELVARPETAKQSYLNVKSRLWDFLGLRIVVGLLLLIVYILVSLIGGFFRYLLRVWLSASGGYNNPGFFLLFVPLELGITLLTIAGYLWFESRFFVVESPLAVETKVRGLQAISRSWELTSRLVLRIQGILAIAYSLLIPILAIFFISLILSLSFFFVSYSTPEGWTQFFWVFFSIVLIFSIVSTLFLMPLWQAIKAVLYYDLRIRREGLGLQLRPASDSAQENNALEKSVADAMRFFKRVTLQTPESVELEFTLAGIGNRALALLIDYLLWYLMLVSFLFLLSVFGSQLRDVLAPIADSEKVELWMSALLILGSFFIYVGYFVFFETLWQGQTPGKRFAKIRVIRDDGRAVGLQQATLRALLRPIDDTFYTFLIGMLLILFQRREKRLGDMLAGTIVIQAESAIAPANFPMSELARNFAAELPHTTTLSALLPDDFAVIREYLQRRGTMRLVAKSELSRKLARQVKEIIALETVPEGVTPDIFLEAVYLAYQRQS